MLTAHTKESVSEEMEKIERLLERMRKFVESWDSHDFLKGQALWIDQEAFRQQGIRYLNKWLRDAESRMEEAIFRGRVVQPRRPKTA